MLWVKCRHPFSRINSCIEEGHWAQLAYLLRSQLVDKTFDLSTFFRSIFESAAFIGEDTGFVENVFQNFVDSLLSYQVLKCFVPVLGFVRKRQARRAGCKRYSDVCYYDDFSFTNLFHKIISFWITTLYTSIGKFNVKQ